MLRSLPGVFCAGEMLDWEAPTGGYLLTACFATGRAAGLGALEWLKQSGGNIMIIVSACLAGVACRYDGAGKPCEAVIRLVAEGQAIPVCPEQLGGLPTPRAACEIIGNKVIRKDGVDVTGAFHSRRPGSLEIGPIGWSENRHPESPSPSCGCGKIYDGSFTGRLVDGNGVFAEMCKQDGMEVKTEEEI